MCPCASGRWQCAQLNPSGTGVSAASAASAACWAWRRRRSRARARLARQMQACEQYRAADPTGIGAAQTTHPRSAMSPSAHPPGRGRECGPRRQRGCRAAGPRGGARTLPGGARTCEDNTMLENVFDARRPGMCASGHVLHGGAVLLGWLPCACPGARHGGHHTWTCRRCLEAGVGDDATLIDGRHDPAHDARQRGPEL